MTTHVKITAIYPDGEVVPTLVPVADIGPAWVNAHNECWFEMKGFGQVRIAESFDYMTDALTSRRITVEPVISDADKICQALDEVTAAVRAVKETIQYRR